MLCALHTLMTHLSQNVFHNICNQIFKIFSAHKFAYLMNKKKLFELENTFYLYSYILSVSHYKY